MIKTNILMYGAGGSGKSSSIASLLKFTAQNPKLKVRFLATESNSIIGLEDGVERYKVDVKPGQLQYMVCRPTENKVSAVTIANDFNKNFIQVSNAQAKAIKVTGADRSKHTTFLNILKGMAVFRGTDFATGEVTSLGDYLMWSVDHILVVDSLTACVDYLVDAVKASRVLTIQSDYGDVQTNLMNRIITPLTEQAKCSVIMIGHPAVIEDNTVKQPKDKEDRITQVGVKTFGQAINATLVSKFSETIYSYVDINDNFYWAGKRRGVVTSPRRFPREDRLIQDYSKYPLFGLKAME